VYWLFDLRDTKLPRRLSFPLLLWNTIDYLAGGTAEPTEAGADRPAAPINGGGTAQPATRRRHRLTCSARREYAVRVERTAGGFIVPDTTRQGIYRRTDERGSEAYAVNLLSPRGAKSLPADRPDDAAVKVGAAGNDRRAGWRRYAHLAWDSLVLAAVAFALCEWFLFHRQVVRVG